jgi:hypothetical protein
MTDEMRETLEAISKELSEILSHHVNGNTRDALRGVIEAILRTTRGDPSK